MSGPWEDYKETSSKPWEDFGAPKVEGNGGAVPAPAIPENTLGQEAKRQGGLFLRAALNAAASPAVLIDKVQAKASDALTGKHLGGSLGEDLNARLTGLGLPEAERPIERFTQGMAESAPAFALPASLPAQVLGNAAISAAQAKPGEEGMGAAIGGTAGVVGHVLGKAVKALTPTEEALLLKSKGVPLTYGQTLGEPVQKLENALARVPYVGAPIRKRQAEALEGWQQATRDQAAPGAKTLEEINNHFADAYGSLVRGQAFNAKPRMDTTAMVGDALSSVAGSTGKMGNRVETEVSELLSNASTPADYQRAESILKKMAFRYKSSQDPEQQIYGEVIANVAGQLRSAWRGALPDGVQAQLSQVDRAYANFVPIRKASSKGVSTLTDPEDYTPRMLLQASRQGSRTGFRNTPQGQLGVAGEQAIGSKANEATSGSGILSLLAGGGAHLLGYTPEALGAAVFGAGYGTKTGQQAMLYTLPVQRAIIEALRRTTPATARSIQE